MPGETDLHKTLKKEACRWLFRMGYRCIAAEVRLKPLGIIDAVGTGIFRAWHNYITAPYELPQVCFIECKASRSDFLRDHNPDGQLTFAMLERRANNKHRAKKASTPSPERPTAMPWDPHNKTIRALRRPTLRQCVGLGKFKSCLAQPMANIHYILAPAGMIQKKDLPPRWGLLSFGEAGVNVVVRATWQECAKRITSNPPSRAPSPATSTEPTTARWIRSTAKSSPSSKSSPSASARSSRSISIRPA